MSNLSPLAATFDLRFRRAWSLAYDDKREEAEAAAAELLLEPRLGTFHQAGMHLLLAMSPDDYLEHALEAVRLYTEIGSRQNMTDFEKNHLEKLLKDANHILNKARQDQTRIDREVQKILASGVTMDELHDIQIKEMNERLDAEEDAATEGADPAGDDVAGSQDVAGMVKDSQMTGTESEHTGFQRTESRRTDSYRTDSQRTDSQRTDSQRTDTQRTDSQGNESQTTVTHSRAVSIADSQRTVTGHLDDDEPLPDIVRYTKKDF